MRTIEFDLITTLLAAMVVYFAGRTLVARVAMLRRLNVPAPVVGGVLVALRGLRARHVRGHRRHQRGASLLAQFVVGFLASTIPPFVTWALGFHLFKINPAVLMRGVAGARSHSGPAREAAKEIDSSVPWVGFPVGYAVSGVLVTVFGYFAMVLSQ